MKKKNPDHACTLYIKERLIHDRKIIREISLIEKYYAKHLALFSLQSFYYHASVNNHELVRIIKSKKLLKRYSIICKKYYLIRIGAAVS